MLPSWVQKIADFLVIDLHIGDLDLIGEVVSGVIGDSREEMFA